MIKKIFTNFYNKNNVVTKWASISAYEKIGCWNSFLDSQDYLYVCSPEKPISYNYASMTLVDDSFLVGYFIGCDKTLLQKTSYANAYDKEFVLFDFAVDGGEKSEEYAKILISQCIEYASFKNCSYLSVQFQNDKYYTFNNLFKSFNAHIFDDKLIIKLNPQPLNEEELLTIPKEGEALSREYMQFLYDKKFEVDQNKFWFEKDGETKILVDKKSAIVTFCNDIVVCDDEPFFLTSKKNLSILSFISSYYIHKSKSENEKIYINKTFYSIDNKEYLLNLVCSSDAMVYFENVTEQVVNEYLCDIERIVCINKSGVKFLNFYNAFYDWEVNFYEIEQSIKPLTNIIRNYALYGKEPPDTLIEKKKVLDKVSGFNKNLNQLKRFYFQMGNPFCGIKKFEFCFLEDGVKIRDNAIDKKIENGFISDKKQIEELLSEIKQLNFVSWQNEYIGEKTIDPKPWLVRLQTNNDCFEYAGVNAYPLNWVLLTYLINDYSYIFNDENDD